MADDPPAIIAIDTDEYHARHVGHTDDGCQFFLTTPFEPAIGGNNGSDFVALYLFNAEGTLLEAKIDDLGPRATVDEERRRQVYE